jgi:tetratricopeptide (TPR) repeat protein
MVPTRLRCGWLAAIILSWTALPLWAADPELSQQLSNLNTITGSDPVEGEIAALVKDAAHTKQLLKRARAAAKNQPLNYNALYILARAAHRLKENDHAEHFYRRSITEALKLESGQKTAQSLGGLIDLFYENEQYDETVKTCQGFLEIEGSESVDRLKPAVIERMVHALIREDKADQAMKVVDALVEQEKAHDGWWFLQLKAWVQHETDHLEDAAKTYETVLERILKNDDLEEAEKTQLAQNARYLLSVVYTDLSQTDKAAELLQALLKEKPDDPTYNNDLGYLWADNDGDLEQAEQLIRKAIDEDRKQREANPDLAPEDNRDLAAYLDSLGWVLFKQGRYAEAKEYLIEAVADEDGSNDIEILNHLGEAHLALGETDEAIAVFCKAADAPAPGRRDQRRKAEIEEKLEKLQAKPGDEPDAAPR